MSKELVLLNGLLRTVAKPSARYMAHRAHRIELHRRAMCRAAGLLAVPEQVRIEPQAIAHFSGEWVHPMKRQSPERVVLYIPGGAFSLMSPITHRGITTRLARYTGARVLAINYRKVPEHPYPSALEDSLATYEWLLEQGIRAENLVVAGDSAGGNLTLSMLQMLRDRGMPLPAAAACFSPWADLAGTGLSMRINRHRDAMVPFEHIRDGALAYANGIALDDPRVSPLYGDFSGLPPMLVHAGDTEMLASDATRLGQIARAAGVEVELKLWRNTPHAFQLFAGVIPQGRRSLSKTASFFARHWATPATQDAPARTAMSAAV